MKNINKIDPYIKNNKRITIKDIAREAKVSIATVSHVINKTHYVSKELTDMVNKVIDKYEYRMDISASSLRKKVSKMIGVIVPNISSQFFAFLTKNIEKLSREVGYHVVICNSDYKSEIDIEHVEDLIARNIDGIIMIPASEETKYYKKIFEYDVPVVLVERKIDGIDWDSVITDSYDSMTQSIDHLVKLGHKKIAYIGREKDLVHSRLRFEGFKDAIKRNKLKINEEFIIHGAGFKFSDGYEDMLKLLNLKDQPTAVLVFSDVIAIGAMRAIQDKGYRIPDDFSVVGFDNIEIDNFTYPKLTSVTTMKEELSKITFKLLINRINRKKIKKKEVLIKTELVIRESTGRAKS